MTRRLDDNPLLDARVRLDSLPALGREVKIASTEDQRTNIADRLGVTSVDELKAQVSAKGFKGGIRVRGGLTATITQPCVVSFEPVTQHIEEKIDRIFLPGARQPKEPAAGAEVFVDLDGEDEPDYFDGPEVDLTELLLEVLALAIDLYPRKPGVEIETFGDSDKDAELSPFAVLAQRKSTSD